MNTQPMKKPQPNEKRAEAKQPPRRSGEQGGERDEPQIPEEARKTGRER